MNRIPKTTFLALLAAFNLSSCATQQLQPQSPPQSEQVDVMEEPKLPPSPHMKEEPKLPPPQHIQIADRKATIVGEKIWMIEGAAQVENLTVWKEGDTFASLGIGSFKWYPAGIESLDNEFPQLLEFLQQQRIALPEWLQSKPACPWNSREEFDNNIDSAKMLRLRKLLGNTFPQQVRFIIKRLERDLPTMLDVLPTDEKREHVREQFYRVAQKPVGIYALIDYVNFQGKGISLNEPYQDDGWGLLQVLENMPGTSSNVMGEFARAADKLLRRRAHSTPKDEHLLPGWRHRLKTYTYEF